MKASFPRWPLVALVLLFGGTSVLEISSVPNTHSLDPDSSGVSRRTDRLRAVHVQDGRIYAIEDHFLYVSSDSGRTYERRGALPKPSGGWSGRLRNWIARRSLLRRIRRNEGPLSLVVLRSGTILVFYDRIYRSTDGGWTLEAVPGTEPNIVPAAFPSSVGRAVGPGDTVYMGEYTTVARPHAVRITRGTEDGTRWETAYTFPPGEVFHVHGIFYDRYRSRYWITTGDRKLEPRLAYTDDGFRTIHELGCCDQSWRMVDLIVTGSSLVWGSDNDESRPGIFRYDFTSGSLTRVADLDNPSYHAALLANGDQVVTTTYEPGTLYTQSDNPSPGTSLWLSKDGVRWTRRLWIPGDGAGIGAGERPQIRLPSGDPLPWLLATPSHTAVDDFVLLQFAPME